MLVRHKEPGRSSSHSPLASTNEANDGPRAPRTTRPSPMRPLYATTATHTKKRPSAPGPTWSMTFRKKTLVLDLDETLIHGTLSSQCRSYHHPVEIMVENVTCLYYIYKRPHVDYFLKKVSEWYNVVVFTASIMEYADPVIDYLDPHRTLIQQRYFRESCIQQGCNFLKDLTIVEPDLSHVCLIDNSPASYLLNRENGIPIQAWYNNDPQDEELLNLLPFLDALRFTQDIRSILGFRLYTEFPDQ
ncbi:Nuclear envelope morphology protein 1 [Dispira simplex]|nr:Nuclear envelope morphology protein 1 [Dispira simplex]